jgi:NAD(P)-dependent dehydrogenase (short-subunit alcohol dehydrogenase family)
MDWFWLIVSSTIFYVVVIIILRVFDSDEIGEPDDSMAGFSIIVTGANSGIGRQTALQLAARGASLTLACRDIKSGNETAQYIISKTGNKYIDVQYLDLEDFNSVRKFAENVQRCHCLVNNAGLILSEKIVRDDTELTMRTNHLGPFLLTNLLLPCLIRSSAKYNTESRIVFVGSKLEKKSDFELGDLTWMSKGPGVYDKWSVYANSKLCNLLTAAELKR